MTASRPAAARDGYPARVVCLTEETTETLYGIGAGDLVVGVSAYTRRPPEAKSKPRVSAFLNANYEKILALHPDVVLAFSDLQADIARELVKRGIPVFTFNQRSVEEILTTVRLIGGVVGYHAEAQALARDLATGLDRMRERAARLPRRPRVYFEEWDDPLITGIRWVSELVGIAGGEDIFPEMSAQAIATGRVVPPEEVVRRAPDVILASWCGKPVKIDRLVSRPGFDAIPAVRAGRVHEIDSTIILQPGPAALTDGVGVMHRRIREAVESTA